jgi:hypothetical protein
MDREFVDLKPALWQDSFGAVRRDHHHQIAHLNQTRSRREVSGCSRNGAAQSKPEQCPINHLKDTILRRDHQMRQLRKFVDPPTPSDVRVTVPCQHDKPVDEEGDCLEVPESGRQRSEGHINVTPNENFANIDAPHRSNFEVDARCFYAKTRPDSRDEREIKIVKRA